LNEHQREKNAINFHKIAFQFHAQSFSVFRKNLKSEIQSEIKNILHLKEENITLKNDCNSSFKNGKTMYEIAHIYCMNHTRWQCQKLD
jgi:hypothetical protein